jgi:predicted transposase/invertase (TIGR01784 family)
MKHIRFDWAAKKMLRDKANFDILEGFLSELLKENIFIENILESETNKEEEDDKFNRVDLLVKNSNNELIIIEIQNTRELDYLFRLLFITSKTITENMKEGKSYSSVIKVITISVIYFELGQGKDYMYYGTIHFKGIHKKDDLQLSEGQKKLFQKQHVNQIFPEHYLIRITSYDEETIGLTQDKFDEWVYFLKTSEIKDNFTAKGIDKARQKLTVLNMSENERKAYEKYLDKISTEASVAETLKFDAEQEIRKEEKIEIAKEMKKNGEPIDKIMLYTGLSHVEIDSFDEI